MTRTTAFGLALILSVSGCIRAPEPDALASEIKSHLRQLAPNGLEGDRWDAVSVEVTGVERIARGRFSTRFQVFNPERVSHASDSARGPEFDLVLARQGGEWSVVEYGAPLRVSVARLVAKDRESEYQHLLPTLDDLHARLYDVWRPWMKERKWAFASASSARERERLVSEMTAGPSPEALRRSLEEGGLDVPAGVEWGLTATPGSPGVILWVRSRSAPDEVCAKLFGYGAPASEFGWIEGNFNTCRGRRSVFVRERAVQHAAAWIDARARAVGTP